MMRAAVLALALVAPALAQPPVTPDPMPHGGIDPCQACYLESLQKPSMIDNALSEPDRSMEHRLRDKTREVRRIIEASWPKFLTMTGARVLDVGAGGGYLALIFSSLVGDKGHVDIHNTPGWIAQFPGMDPDAQKRFIKRANIGWVTASWNELDAPAESYDIIVMGQVYHDIILESGDFDALNKRLFAMLKPGGLVVIEDHDAIETMYLGQQVGLHRISHGDVTGQLLRAGFSDISMELIESSYDDRRFNVFRPGVRGRTDRFIAVFMKPLDGRPVR